MAIKTYDPSDVLGTLAGIIFSGYADGTFLSVDKAEDTFSTSIGATGFPTRVRNRNESGTVTITLQASSRINDQLSLLHNLDLLSNAGKGPLLIKDAEGTTLVAAEDAWIKKIPTVEYAKDMPVRVWVIDCPKLVMFVGGLL